MWSTLGLASTWWNRQKPIVKFNLTSVIKRKHQVAFFSKWRNGTSSSKKPLTIFENLWESLRIFERLFKNGTQTVEELPNIKENLGKMSKLVRESSRIFKNLRESWRIFENLWKNLKKWDEDGRKVSKNQRKSWEQCRNWSENLHESSWIFKNFLELVKESLKSFKNLRKSLKES